MVLPHQPAAAPFLLPIWSWFAGGAVLLLALAALLLRRRGPRDDGTDDQAAGYAPADAIVPPAPTAPAARLSIELRPTRAGVNLLTALVEAEVIVANIGDAAAVDIRAAVTLLGGGTDTDATLDALAGRPVGQPTVPPFTLAPDEERRFRAIAALPHDAIEPLTVAGRPMFVPLVAVTARWTADATPRRTTRGFAVGVERVDSAKLGPLWLDLAPRSYDSVAARPHGAARET